MPKSVLDNPVWTALNSIHTEISIGQGPAKRFRPDISPLAGVLDQSCEHFSKLTALCTSGDELNLFQASPIVLPSTFELIGAGVVWQLVKTNKETINHANIKMTELGYEHRLQMLELATLTKPGLFSESSYLFGGFLGVFENDRLVAMAGERLRQPGYTEVSGVCTHPDYRGRGLAKTLSSAVTNRVRSRNEDSYLHAYTDNAAAIGLYENLGYEKRAKLNLVKVKVK